MEIILGGYLTFYHPEKENRLSVEVSEPASLLAVLQRLDFPTGEIHLAVVNGEAVDMAETIVSNQDEVKLYSAVGGG